MSRFIVWALITGIGCLVGMPARSEAAGTKPWSITLKGGLLVTNPEARVREFDQPGTFLGLNRQPGLKALGTQGGITLARTLGRFAVELGASYSRNTGQGDSGPGFAFNGGVFPPDRQVASTLETYRLGIRGAWRLSGGGALSHLQ